MLEVIAYPITAAGKLALRLGALQRFLLNLCILVFASSPVLAQTAAVRGQVVDQSA
jgi:hypothetical protein